MGTESVTSVSGTGSTVCGHQKVSIKSRLTIVWPSDGLHHLWNMSIQAETEGAGGEGETQEEELGGGGVGG